MKKVYNRPSLIFFLFVLILWLNFSGHILSTLPLKKFIEGEFESERFVISRLAYNIHHGTSSQGNFMLRYEAADVLRESVDRNDYTTFKQTKSDQEIEIYYSHAGTQDNLLVPLWKGLQNIKSKILTTSSPNSRWHKRMQTLDLYYFVLITQSAVALINAIVLASFLFWVKKEFSSKTSWLTLGFILIFIPVLTYFGRSMWWMMWSWYLPLLILLWWTYIRKHFKWYDAIAAGTLGACAIMLKVTMGYEYTSSVMMGVLIPPTYYAIKNNWRLQEWFTNCLIIGSLALCGFAAGLAYHWVALDSFDIDPFSTILSKFSMRAHGGANPLKGEMAESVNASFFAVLAGYLVSPKELMPPQILLMTPFLLMLWNRRHHILQDRIFAALSACIGLGFIGATSMLFVLKGHAYIHGFDIVVWNIPMNLLLGVLYARETLLISKHDCAINQSTKGL